MKQIGADLPGGVRFVLDLMKLKNSGHDSRQAQIP
jgi:hypothetical protein